MPLSHPLSLATEIVGLLRQDRVAAAQLKQVASPAELVELLDLAVTPELTPELPDTDSPDFPERLAELTAFVVAHVPADKLIAAARTHAR